MSHDPAARPVTYRQLLRRIGRILVLVLRSQADRWLLRWRAEARELIVFLVLSVAAFVFFLLGLSAALLALFVALWETGRVLAFVIAAAVFLVCGGAAVLAARANARRFPP